MEKDKREAINPTPDIRDIKKDEAPLHKTIDVEAPVKNETESKDPEKPDEAVQERQEEKEPLKG